MITIYIYSENHKTVEYEDGIKAILIFIDADIMQKV